MHFPIRKNTLLQGAAAIAAALLAGTVAIARPVFAQSTAPLERGSVALANALNSLGNTSRVLVIGAHPDDEDTQLIAWLARGRHVETAYLSLTRGDGGQNLIGNELGESLGVIRTQELLAARGIDGGRQFFTRAFDFGFSKNAEETLTHWPRDTVMGDVIRVVRSFRPQIIVAIFSGTPRDGHGHHQVSGIFARDAFDNSADTVKYPVSAYGAAWTASKFYRRVRSLDSGTTVRINVGEYDPVVGRSYAEIAADSRSQHKSQGFGVLQQKGAIIDQIGLEGSRVSDVKATIVERSIFDGIDTTWARLRKLSGAASVQGALDAANAAFLEARTLYRADDPSPTVAPLARAVRALRVVRDSAGAPPPRLMIGPRNQSFYATPPANVANVELWNAADVNLQRAERALLLAAGVAVEALAPKPTLPVTETAKRNVPDTMTVDIAVYNRGKSAIRVTGANVGAMREAAAVSLQPDSVLRVKSTGRANSVTKQWWRTAQRADGWFIAAVDSRDDAQRALQYAIQARVRVEVGGVPIDVVTPVVNRVADPVKGEQLVAVSGVPGIAVGLAHGVEYIRANVPVTRDLGVFVLSSYAQPETVTVSLTVPKGLVADSAKRVRILTPDAPGLLITFRLRGVVPPGRFELFATATHAGQPANEGYYTITYDHIPPQRLYAGSGMYMQAVEAVRPLGARVGYIQGVGDAGLEALLQLDIAAEPLNPNALATTDLSRFTAIIVGPRAYASNDVLVANNARLLEYAKRGGTLIVQYGQQEMMKPGIMPYPIQLARTAERVTMETAPVNILAPGARLLKAPNKITAADWEGWVQERATYMPTTFDKHYSPLLQMNDPDEPPNKSGLLVAGYGKGTYVYVTLALFRQLPSGVPGAARLLLNLLTATPTSATTPRM